MRLGDLRKATENLPDDTPICTAEIGEAFGTFLRSADIVEDARERPEDAAEEDKYQLSGGGQTVIVLRHG